MKKSNFYFSPCYSVFLFQSKQTLHSKMTIRYCALFKRKRTRKCFANRIQFRKRVSKNFFQTYRFLFF